MKGTPPPKKKKKKKKKTNNNNPKRGVMPSLLTTVGVRADVAVVGTVPVVHAPISSRGVINGPLAGAEASSRLGVGDRLGNLSGARLRLVHRVLGAVGRVSGGVVARVHALPARVGVVTAAVLVGVATVGIPVLTHDGRHWCLQPESRTATMSVHLQQRPHFLKVSCCNSYQT